LGLRLESDSDESLTQRPKDSCSSEHDFSALDPTLVETGVEAEEELLGLAPSGSVRVQLKLKCKDIREEEGKTNSGRYG
jgi:hypothetical protein